MLGNDDIACRTYAQNNGGPVNGWPSPALTQMLLRRVLRGLSLEWECLATLLKVMPGSSPAMAPPAPQPSLATHAPAPMDRRRLYGGGLVASHFLLELSQLLCPSMGHYGLLVVQREARIIALCHVPPPVQISTAFWILVYPTVSAVAECMHEHIDVSMLLSPRSIVTQYPQLFPDDFKL